MLGFPSGSVGKESACNVEDLSLIPGSERSPGEENGNPLQYSCLENPMDGGAGGLQAIGSQRVRQDWVTSLSLSFWCWERLRAGEENTEGEIVGWHHWLDGCEFEQTLGDSEGQGILKCCSSWGLKESDMTEQLNNNNKPSRQKENNPEGESEIIRSLSLVSKGNTMPQGQQDRWCLPGALRVGLPGSWGLNSYFVESKR